MDQRTLEWFDLLARMLVWAAGIVLLLSLLGAIFVLASDNSLPFFEDIQRESRGIFAIAALGAGLSSAGILSGLGAILRLLLVGHRERAGADAPAEAAGAATAPTAPTASDHR